MVKIEGKIYSNIQGFFPYYPGKDWLCYGYSETTGDKVLLVLRANNVWETYA